MAKVVSFITEWVKANYDVSDEVLAPIVKYADKNVKGHMKLSAAKFEGEVLAMAYVFFTALLSIAQLVSKWVIPYLYMVYNGVK